MVWVEFRESFVAELPSLILTKPVDPMGLGDLDLEFRYWSRDQDNPRLVGAAVEHLALDRATRNALMNNVRPLRLAHTEVADRLEALLVQEHAAGDDRNQAHREALEFMSAQFAAGKIPIEGQVTKVQIIKIISDVLRQNGYKVPTKRREQAFVDLVPTASRVPAHRPRTMIKSASFAEQNECETGR